MRVLLATPRGVCAGVERAVEIVELALERFGPPVFVRREIVHNRHIVTDLQERGAVFVQELTEVPDGATVIFSAHGISPTVRDEAQRRGLRSIDATCPLVTKVHLEVLRFVERGFHILLVGHAGHDEVTGTMGHAPGGITLITSQEDARNAIVPDTHPLMVVTQTTLSMDDTREIVALLRARFPSLQQPPADDICYATQNRQTAVKAMVDAVDLLLVVGSANSSNATRLVEVARSRGIPGHLIDSEEDVIPEWFGAVGSVGVTAGASTPEAIVQRVVARLRDLGAHDVQTFGTVVENVTFALPHDLR